MKLKRVNPQYFCSQQCLKNYEKFKQHMLPTDSPEAQASQDRNLADVLVKKCLQRTDGRCPYEIEL